MTLRLSELVDKLGGVLYSGKPGQKIQIRSVTSSSKAVAPGSVFVAIKGTKTDGHTFLNEAAEKKAALILVESSPPTSLVVPCIEVKDTRRALSTIAALLCDYPSKKLQVYGVTGTNGKTTINWLIAHILIGLGIRTLRTGTLGTFFEAVLGDPETLTCPDAITVQQSLRTALKHGANAAVLEASSHALSQHRIADVNFDVGIFTNLTRDHLDYHRDMESYFVAKKKLFDLLNESGKPIPAAIINTDDEYGERLCRELKKELRKATVITCGRDESCDVRIKEFTQNVEGSELTLSFQLNNYQINSGFIGAHNANNLSQVFAALVSQNHDAKAVCDALSKAPMVPGRLQRVLSPEIGVYVDYSHTPDSLQSALTTLRPIVDKGKLWVVFGCGGDRDKGKRPQMAAVAAALSDFAIATSDNPRTESPEAILRDIQSGGARLSHVEVDRRKAIFHAIKNAKKGDVILIAGKGHEDYQIFGTEKTHFSDVEVSAEAILDREATHH